MLERLKDLARSVPGISTDTMLVFLGLGCFLAACLVMRRPLSWGWALVPGVCLSIILEIAEILDHYGARGLLAAEWTDIGAILLRHSRDVLIMNLGPLLVVLAATLLDRLPRD